MADYKTPGVYIKEINTMSGTISAVETALPAFIGYTEKATQGNQSLFLKPTPISSMMDYVELFGQGDNQSFTFDGSTPTQDVSKVFSLYDSIQMFFRNGGGDCYIVSVGTYGDSESEGSIYNTTRKNLDDSDRTPGKSENDFQPGLDILKKYIEPTMVVIPDAVFIASDNSKCFSIQQAMMKHCGEEMQNRVAILDIFNGYQDRTSEDDTDVIIQFRNNINQYLDFGAAYYPWVVSSLYNSNNVTYNFISNDIDATTTTVINRVNLQNAIVTNLGLPDSGDIAGDYDTIVAISKLNPGWDKIAGYTVGADAFGDKLVTILETDKAFKATIDLIKADGKTGAAILAEFNVAAADESTTPKYPIPYDLKTHQTLSKIIPPKDGNNDVPSIYQETCNTIQEKVNLVPTSPIMAGIYTYVDNTAGVGRAPANYAISGINGPACIVTSKDQEDLNKPLNGKAVNAIRAFKNRGTLVWGARTMDGNSGDWRYVNVRRSVIMIETSIKLALEAYVFRPNTLATWIDLETQINAFLIKQWNAGILVGSSQDQAFQVGIGIGVTMTSQDVIDGIMRISVKLAVTRPAEFIEVTFEQMMPTA